MQRGRLLRTLLFASLVPLATSSCFFSHYVLESSPGSGGSAGASSGVTRTSSDGGQGGAGTGNGNGGSAGGGAPHGTKWHPGVYFWSGNTTCTDDDYFADKGTLDLLANDPNFQGVELVVDWKCLEQTATGAGGAPMGGDYSRGFKLVDDYLALVRPTNRRLMLVVNTFGSGTCTGPELNQLPNGGYTGLPGYLYDLGYIDYCTDQNTRPWVAEIWRAEVMQSLIDLSRAYAARYDSDENFEMFSFVSETSAFYGDGGNGSTVAGSVQEIEEFFGSAKADWKRTLLRNPINVIGQLHAQGSDDDMRGLIAKTAGPRVVFGGPDSFPDGKHHLQGDLVFRGLNGDGTTPSPLFTDYRGKHPWIAHTTTHDFCGNSYCDPTNQDDTLQSIATYAHDVAKDSYVVWLKNLDKDEPTSTQWPAEQTLIDAGKSAPALTACFAENAPCDSD